MTEPGLIIIGSGPAGVSAAEAFRQHDTARRVQILTDDGALPYARPPLSKEYLRGESDDVALHSEMWFSERDIEIVHAGVGAIDTVAKTVSAGGHSFPYRNLVIATGCEPSAPPIPGADRALLLRSLDDATRLREAAGSATTAVVIGAGFIGCEAAASLARQGVSVTVVAPQRVPQVARLGEEAGERLLKVLRDAGVTYVGSAEVTEIMDGSVALEDGTRVAGDVVLAAVGVTPRADVAKRAGLDVRNGRIVVGSDMRTSADDVFAAGDVALAFNASAGRHLPTEHWGDALEHGEIAGAGAAGVDQQWASVPGFWSTIGDTTVKYHAWGDGHETADLVDHGDGFTVWYSSQGLAVGVLTCNADDDYELGEDLIAQRRPAPTAGQ